MGSKPTETADFTPGKGVVSRSGSDEAERDQQAMRTSLCLRATAYQTPHQHPAQI